MVSTNTVTVTTSWTLWRELCSSSVTDAYETTAKALPGTPGEMRATRLSTVLGYTFLTLPEAICCDQAPPPGNGMATTPIPGRTAPPPPKKKPWHPAASGKAGSQQLKADWRRRRRRHLWRMSAGSHWRSETRNAWRHQAGLLERQRCGACMCLKTQGYCG